MFIEHRTYSLRPGMLHDYFEGFGARGLELNRRAAELIGWYHSEAGDLFQMVGLWRHESFADRLRKKAALYEDPEWRDIMGRVQPFVQRIESRFCTQMPFWHGRPGAPGAADGSSFIEHRIYQLRPGATHAYLQEYGQDGFDLHETHAPCVGFYMTEAGALFQLVSMWRFDSFEQRIERRAELNANPLWQAKMGPMSTMVERIESKFILPVPFWNEAEEDGR